MGLDFGVVKKRKGKAYESDCWEDVVWGRNCHKVKEIVLDNISSYDKENCEAKLSIGTINNLIIKLAESLKSYDLNNKDTFENDDYTKTLDFLSGLAKGIYKDCIDYEYGGISYEYKLIDSF